MIYFLLIVLIFFCIYTFDIRQGDSKRGKSTAYYFLLVVLVLIAGLRYRIGTDTITYENWFSSSGVPTLWNLTMDDFSYNRWEPLFVLFGVIIKTIFGDHWVAFQIVHALIVNYAFFWFFKKYSTYPFICCLFYYVWLFYPLNCEVMRQSLATAFWIFSLPFLFKRNYLKYYIIIVICFFIHRGSAFFALVPLLRGLQNRKVFFPIILLLLVIAKPLSDWINDNLFSFILLFGDSSSGTIETLSNYTESAGMVAYEFSLIGTLAFLFYNVIVYLLVVTQVTGRKKKEQGGYNDFFCDYSYMVYTFVILQMVSLAIPVFYRFSWLLSAFPVVYLAEFFGTTKKFTNVKELAYTVSIFFLFSLSLYSNYSHREDETNYRYYQRFCPYSSVLNPQKNMDRENIYYMYNK